MLKFFNKKKREPKPEDEDLFMKCIKIDAAEEKGIMQQKEHFLVYRCQTCSKNSGISPALENLIILLNKK